MLYREIIAVCSHIHTRRINTLWGLSVELLNVKPGGTYSDHWDYILTLMCLYAPNFITASNVIYTL